MKKYFLLFILVSIVLISCIPQSPIVVVSNQTIETYDSIKVYSSPENQTTFFDVLPKTVMQGKIHFDSNNISDGAYIIEIYRNGNIPIIQNFGYYTNGAPLNRKIEIKILTDTIYFQYY